MNRYFLFLFSFITLVVYGQQTDTVDFLKIDASVQPMASEEKIVGSMEVQFSILKDADSIYLDAINMKVLPNHEISDSEIKTSAFEDKIWFTSNFKAGKSYQASFSFEATPKQTLYFTGEQIWTQGQGKYTSHWLPSLDDMNDKIEFDLAVVVPSEKIVIANGALISVAKKGNLSHWKFDMQHPMSSYLVAIVVGNFQKKSLTSDSGIAIDLYYLEQDADKYETTYRHSLKIFNFLENEIGIGYPWQNYKQVPVRDFLYAGMENTTATIFSEAFVVDSTGFNDRNYINVNAHELAHQWFGDLITETEGTHHWLQEGFATYYALLAEKEIFGDDFYYWKLFQSAEKLKALSDEGKGERLLDPKASSLTFYEKGAWALHILKELIGEESFKLAIKKYLEKHQFQNVTTDDFLTEVRGVTSVDITQWEADWLQQTAFKAEQAYESLVKSPFIVNYFEVSALRMLPLQEKKNKLSIALTFPNEFIGQEAIYQLSEEPIVETLQLYKKAFDSNNLFIRQSIALSLENIPAELQTEFESLLDDNSYVTKEAALYLLWIQFPEKRAVYLDKLIGVVGFQNKNVRQLWLTLAIVTENYKVAEKNNFIAELKSYSSNDFSFEIRETAFGFLHELQLYDTAVLSNLVNASVHHNWRFRSYARGLLDEALKNTTYKNMLSKMMKDLSEKEKQFLNRKFSE